MPFNGAGIFSRTPGTRIANQGPLVSAQVNDETDNLVTGINGKVNLDGLLAMTGLQLLFGDGTALLHGATVRQVQNGVLSHATAVAGTADAIQVTMTPANTTLTLRERIRWTSAGANTVVAPTLSKDAGVTNKTIKKGVSAALAVGDTGAAGYECEAEYNGTDWILLNPVATGGSALSAASTTEVLTGTDTTKYVTADANAALWEKGSDIASAGTISVGEGGTFDVTGTTTITDIDPATDKAGRTFRLVHEGIHLLTHNASTMINITGADITTAVGDISTWQSEGSDVVRMVNYQRASGAGLVAGASGPTVVAKAADAVIVSGTFANDADFTFAMAASTKYRIKFRMNLNTTGAPTLGAKFQLSGPAIGAGSVSVNALCFTAGGAVDYSFSTSATWNNAFLFNGDASVDIEVVWINGTTAGTFNLQIARNGGTSTTFKKNSSMSYEVFT